jgi:hypothetical protein
MHIRTVTQTCSALLNLFSPLPVYRRGLEVYPLSVCPSVRLSELTEMTMWGEYPCSIHIDGTCEEKGCLWGANTLVMGF